MLLPQQEKSSREPRPVYYREMNLLGMDKRWKYPQNDDAPIMWAEAERYIYRGRMIARTKGGGLFQQPEIVYTEEEGIPDDVCCKRCISNASNTTYSQLICGRMI